MLNWTKVKDHLMTEVIIEAVVNLPMRSAPPVVVGGAQARVTVRVVTSITWRLLGFDGGAKRNRANHNELTGILCRCTLLGFFLGEQPNVLLMW